MKKLLNRRIAIVAVAVIATVAFFSFKSGDDRNFQIAKNLDIFNAIVKELDMFYVDTIDPNKTIREGIDNMLYTLDPYTEYYPEEDQSELEQMIKGSFGGIGSYIAYNTKLKRSMISEPVSYTHLIFYIPFFYPIILFFYFIPYLPFKHLLNKFKKFPYQSISPLQIG